MSSAAPAYHVLPSKWYAGAALDIPYQAGVQVQFRISADVSLAQTHDGPVMLNKHAILLAASMLPGTICCQLLAADTETQPKLQVIQTGNGYEFLEGKSSVLFYQTVPKSLDGKFERAGYVHPLYDLDANVISEDFPADHLHHRGVFWAWHQLTVDGNQVGDPWICRDFLSRVDNVTIAKRSSDAAAIEATAYWVSPDWKDSAGTMKPMVREETRIEVRRSGGNSRTIDFRIKLTALEAEIYIGGSDDIKGYGGFSPRLRLPEDIRFTAEYGEVEPQRTAVKASRWMDISGTFNKQENVVDGVTILCHPSLPGFPQKWILRKARSMQNPVFPGRVPIALPTKEPLELRYRLIVHRGVASHEQLKLWFDKYAAEE
jgi:hypothetical protein